LFYEFMIPTSVARWGAQYAAASGRRRHFVSTAVVKTESDDRSLVCFGYRKATRGSMSQFSFNSTKLLTKQG